MVIEADRQANRIEGHWIEVDVAAGSSGETAFGRGALRQAEGEARTAADTLSIVAADVGGNAWGIAVEDGTAKPNLARAGRLATKRADQVRIPAGPLTKWGITLASVGTVFADVVRALLVEITRHARAQWVVVDSAPIAGVLVAAALRVAEISVRVTRRCPRSDLTGRSTERHAEAKGCANALPSAGIDVTSDFGAVAGGKSEERFIDAKPVGFALLVVFTFDSRFGPEGARVLTAVRVEVAEFRRVDVVHEAIARHLGRIPGVELPVLVRILAMYAALVMGAAAAIANLEQEIALVPVAADATGVGFGTASSEADVGI